MDRSNLSHSLDQPLPAEASWDFHPVSELSAVADEWDTLNRNGLDLPILDAAFFELLLRQFSSGKEFVAICRCPGQTLAAAIVEPVGYGRYQTYQPSQAPLGAWLKQKDLSSEKLLQTLARSMHRTCMVLSVTQQDPTFEGPPESTSHLRTMDYIKTARVDIRGDFDEYWSARGKNLRQNTRKQRNRLNREDTHIHMVTADDPSAVGTAVDEFGELESAGWKGREGTAVHATNAQGRFYRELMTSYAGRSEAVCFQFYYGEKLTAADLCLKRGGCLIVLKTAHDEEQRKTSPATLMREDIFRHIFASRDISRVEFYGRVMDWHTRWTDEVRTLYHLTYYRMAFLARLSGTRPEPRQSAD